MGDAVWMTGLRGMAHLFRPAVPGNFFVGTVCGEWLMDPQPIMPADRRCRRCERAEARHG